VEVDLPISGVFLTGCSMSDAATEHRGLNTEAWGQGDLGILRDLLSLDSRDC
jgi:hypothetical protein